MRVERSTYSGLREKPVQNCLRTLERTTWTSCESRSPTTALIFLDGELYLERVRALEVLRDTRIADAISPYVAIFISNGGAAARHKDFVCCPTYASFIAEDVVDPLRHDFSSVRQFVLLGLSLSGLAAAHAATRYPNVFSSVICQSPSFWWQRGHFAAELPAVERPLSEFWISVGDQENESGISHPPSGLLQEMTQIAGCASAVAALRAKGYPVRIRTYHGGHDPDCWREDLELALAWVFRSQE